MKTEAMDNLLILKAENTNLQAFYKTVQEQLLHGEAKDKNLVLDLLSLTGVDLEALLSFQDLSDSHTASAHSFVLVCDGINFNDLPENLHVTPTLQEAKDIVMMEDIERDLGF